MPTPLFQKWNPGGPGRPRWSRNAESLFDDAIEKLSKDLKIDDVERDIVMTLLARAKKWDTRAIEMYLDRKYWKPVQKFTGEVKQELHLSGEKRNMLETLLWLRNK